MGRERLALTELHACPFQSSLNGHVLFPPLPSPPLADMVGYSLDLQFSGYGIASYCSLFGQADPPSTACKSPVPAVKIDPPLLISRPLKSRFCRPFWSFDPTNDLCNGSSGTIGQMSSLGTDRQTPQLKEKKRHDFALLACKEGRPCCTLLHYVPYFLFLTPSLPLSLSLAPLVDFI